MRGNKKLPDTIALIKSVTTGYRDFFLQSYRNDSCEVIYAVS